MDRREIDEELSAAGAQELLASGSAAHAEYLAAARKTMDPDAATEFEQNVRGLYKQMARIAITPGWVRFYDFGAGRMPQFRTDLVGQNQP